MYQHILNLFRRSVTKAVKTPTVSNKYYENYFNQGIRLCHEIQHTKSPVVIAELLLAFEKCNEWEPIKKGDYISYRQFIMTIPFEE